MALTGGLDWRTRRWDWLPLAASIIVAALFAWPLLDRGWTPHDDGMLGQTAERIRLGQLPHRDFEELYTGGLGLWHALAQRVFGTTMMAPRYALFGLWCGWLAMVFGIVKRSTAPWWATAITIAVAMWTLPVYPSAMPSWYLLICATGAAGALLNWNDHGRPRWLLMAGVAVGIGLIVKITALYLLAAALLSIVSATQEQHNAPASVRRKWAPSAAVIVGAVMLAAMVLWLLRDRTAAPELLHLVVPIVLLVLTLSVREVRIVRTGGRNWNELLVPTGWFAAGVAVPVLMFALPYVFTGSFEALMRGVFVDPLTRIGGMNFAMRPLEKTLAGLYFATLVGVELRWGAHRIVKVAAIVVALWFAWRSTQSYVVYQAVWEGARLLLPMSIAIIAFQYARRPSASGTDTRVRFNAMTLAAFAAMFALNQFPFSANVYFCFVAPLVFLALMRATPQAASRLIGTTVLLGTFAVLSLLPGDLNTLGFYPAKVDLDHRLGMVRGGLRVSAGDSAQYTMVQALAEAHRGGLPIFAGPGIPEIPFLAGPPYYGHNVFHFLAYDRRDTTAVAGQMNADSAATLIWNLHPAFGEPVSPTVKAWYDARFPHVARVGEGLEVRWRIVKGITAQP